MWKPFINTDSLKRVPLCKFSAESSVLGPFNKSPIFAGWICPERQKLNDWWFMLRIEQNLVRPKNKIICAIILFLLMIKDQPYVVALDISDACQIKIVIQKPSERCE